MKKNMLWAIVASAVALSATPILAQDAPAVPKAAATEAPRANPPQRWMYLMTNLINPKSFDDAVALVKRSAKAGYTGIAIYDSKFAKFKFYPDHPAKLAEFRKACDEAKMDFIVGVTPMGYSDELLANDPNLAEGMPVRNAVFVVKDGKLVPDAEGVAVRNPSFEEVADGKVARWEMPPIIEPDKDVKSDGAVSVRMTEDGGKTAGGRVSQQVAVKPWHYYHVSVMAKTEDYTSKDNRIQIIDGSGLVLDWQPPPIEKTMDWKRLDATFCSLDNTEVRLMIGRWDGKGGKIWYDDVKIEPGGFVNIIRRDSLPLKVASEDGKTIYEEGKDFSKVADPKLIHDPNPGYYTIWHDAPVVTIPEGSRLKEGQKVLASYHFAVSAGKPGQLNACFSEPKVYQLIEDEIRYLKDNGKPDMYFMVHDEIRLAGWDDTCAKRNMTCGQLLADNISKCTAIIEKVDPGKPMFVWSDMFDPHHNARKTDDAGKPFVMYLAKGPGPWYGSWEGLGKQVGLINWNGGRLPSYKNFSEAGHQQIVSGNNPELVVKWLKEVGQLPGVVGVMYTTWTNDYGPTVEKYVEAVKAWEKESGPFKK